MLTRFYRIPTSLSIARARIAELLPRALELPDGTALLALEHQAQDEAYYLVLRPTEYLTRCGPWQVRATPDALHWTFAGAQVTLTPAGEAAFAGGDARAQRAIACVMVRLPALRLPDMLWGWRLDMRLVAVTPTETIAAWWTLRMGEVSARLEQGIGALWPAAGQVSYQQVETLSNGVLPPHSLRERRERVRELYLAGKSRKEIAQAIRDSVDTVKNDLDWLREYGYLPRGGRTQDYPKIRSQKPA